MDEEKKWEELWRLVQKMRDAMTVDVAIKLKHEDRIKEHEEWLRQNELAAARHQAWIIRMNELRLRRYGTNGNLT